MLLWRVMRSPVVAQHVIAININGLLAHSTVDYTLEQRYAQSVRHAYTEVAGAKDGVVPVFGTLVRKPHVWQLGGASDARSCLTILRVRFRVNIAQNQKNIKFEDQLFENFLSAFDAINYLASIDSSNYNTISWKLGPEFNNVQYVKMIGSF